MHLFLDFIVSLALIPRLLIFIFKINIIWNGYISNVSNKSENKRQWSLKKTSLLEISFIYGKLYCKRSEMYNSFQILSILYQRFYILAISQTRLKIVTNQLFSKDYAPRKLCLKIALAVSALQPTTFLYL